MKRRYSFCVHGSEGRAFGGEVEAESAAEAMALALERARQRWGSNAEERVSMIAEEVNLEERGPIALAMSMDYNGERICA